MVIKQVITIVFKFKSLVYKQKHRGYMTKQIVKDCIVKVVKEDGELLKLDQKYKVYNTEGCAQNHIEIWYGNEKLSLNKDFFELSSKYEITDSVALASPGGYPEIKLGQVGTIVEVLGIYNDVYEVEFCDDNGRTLSTCAIKEKHLLKLYFN